VLAGNAGVEAAAQAAGHDLEVPFTPGPHRRHAEQTDAESFAVLEPQADGFRNYQKTAFSVSPEEMLVDKAQLLTLSAPEMTVLVGGLRVLGRQRRRHPHGVFTTAARPADQRLLRQPARHGHGLDARAGDNVLRGRDRKTGALQWTATRVDLVFGSNSQLRAWPRSTPAADNGPSSCATSSRPGPR
jgi:catalase-peroxidase